MTSQTPAVDQGSLAGFTFSVAPDLPEGVTLDSATGMVSGTPKYISSAGTYTVSAAKGSTRLSVEISVTVDTQFSGSVGFVESHLDNAAGIDGLDEAYRVAVSKDGKKRLRRFTHRRFACGF